MNNDQNTSMITSWVIQYNQYNFPDCIQGILISDDSKLNGKPIICKNIEVVDFKDNWFALVGGETKYILHGPGQRLVLVDEIECQNFDDDIDEDENLYEYYQ
jgi:hypothetical protein